MANILKFASRQKQHGTSTDDSNHEDNRIESTLETLITAANAVAKTSSSASRVLLSHLDTWEQTFSLLDEDNARRLSVKADTIRGVLERMI